MANTFDAALVTDVARLKGIMVLQNKLAALGLISTDFSLDPIAPKKTIQVPKVLSGSTAQTNAANFESGDSNIDNIAVVPDQLSVSFHITNAQLQQGFRLESLFEINLQVLANKIMDVTTAPLTVANFGTAAVTAAAEDFGTDDLKTLYALAKNYNQKGLVLDGSYLAQFIPTDKLHFALGEQGAYGFDKIAPNNRWTGADANVVGAVIDPQAIGAGSGLSIIDPALANLMMIRETIIIPGINLPVQFCVWASMATRAIWGSYDVMYGAALGDASAAELIMAP